MLLTSASTIRQGAAWMLFSIVQPLMGRRRGARVSGAAAEAKGSQFDGNLNESDVATDAKCCLCLGG